MGTDRQDPELQRLRRQVIPLRNCSSAASRPFFGPFAVFARFSVFHRLHGPNAPQGGKNAKWRRKCALLLVGCSQSPTVTTNDLAGAGAGPARKRPRRRVRRLFTRDLWDLWLSSRFPAVSWLASSAKTATCTASEKTSIAYRENGRERPGNGETHPKDRSVQVGRGGGREREAAGGG